MNESIRDLVNKITGELHTEEPAAVIRHIGSHLHNLLDAQLSVVFGRSAGGLEMMGSFGNTYQAKQTMELAKKVIEDGEMIVALTADELDELGVGDLKPPLVVIPLKAFGDIRGVFCQVETHQDLVANVNDVMEILQPAVNLLAFAINSLPDGEVLLRLAEICVRFLEEKDPYTHGHSLRVAKYALLIAEELGLPGREREDLRLCALLHDIGKVVIRDSVLRRPGPLGPAEWDVIKVHPEIGSSITAKVSKHLAPYVRSHHERYDGNGYPQGLTGEEIPYISRIIAVADTFDAITSIRPYRPRRTADEAVTEISDNSGSQFDPGIVEALLKLHERGALSDEGDVC